MRPLIEELAGLVPIYVSVYPNAGLPNPLRDGFLGTPETLAPQLKGMAQNGWPQYRRRLLWHDASTSKPLPAVHGLPPRVPPKSALHAASGLEPLTLLTKMAGKDAVHLRP